MLTINYDRSDAHPTTEIRTRAGPITLDDDGDDGVFTAETELKLKQFTTHYYTRIGPQRNRNQQAYTERQPVNNTHIHTDTFNPCCVYQSDLRRVELSECHGQLIDRLNATACSCGSSNGTGKFRVSQMTV